MAVGSIVLAMANKDLIADGTNEGLCKATDHCNWDTFVAQSGRRLLGDETDEETPGGRRLTGGFVKSTSIAVIIHSDAADTSSSDQSDTVDVAAVTAAISNLDLSKLSSDVETSIKNADPTLNMSVVVTSVDAPTTTNITVTQTSTTMTTSTSTTTTGPAHIKSAFFTQKYTSLEVLFDIPILFCPGGLCKTSRVIDCAGFWDAATSAALGLNPVCMLSGDRFRMYITFGRDATFAVGDNVTTTNQPFIEVWDFDHLDGISFTPIAHQLTSATTADLDNVLDLKLIARPDRAQPCTDIAFSVAGTVGSNGRPLHFVWTFGTTTPPAIVDALTESGVLAKAQGSPVLNIDAGVMWNVVQSLNVAYPFRLDAKCIVKNWLGVTAEKMIHIDVVSPDSTDSLSVVAMTPTSRKIRRYNAVEFVARVLPIPTHECSGFPAMTGSIAINWEYKLASDSTWKNKSVFPLNTDANRQSNTVDFPAYTFESNRDHHVRAIATLGNKVTTVVFEFHVDSDYVNPVVWGPDVAYLPCDVYLNASDSFDPNDAAKDGSPSVPFDFRWQCEPIITANQTETVTLANGSIVSCVSSCAVLGCEASSPYECSGGIAPNAAIWHIPGSTFTCPGLYRWGVTVSRAGVDYGTAVLWTTYYDPSQAPSGSAPPISVATWTKWVRGTSISTHRFNQPYDVYARVYEQDNQDSGTGTCSKPRNPLYQWVLIDHTQGFSGWDSTMIAQFVPGATGLVLTEFPLADWKLLRSGGMYAFALLSWPGASQDKWQALQWRLGNNTPTYLEAASFDYSFRYSETAIFVAVGAPSGGNVFVNPRRGGALEDMFSVATSGWTDLQERWIDFNIESDESQDIYGGQNDLETRHPIEYMFYRFPAHQDSSLRYNNASHQIVCTVVSGGKQNACDVTLHPTVTFYDYTSPQYYRAWGARPLTTWLPEGQSMITFPRGNFNTVVVAKDSLGGISYQYAYGPLVAPAKDITADQVIGQLQQQVNFGDPVAVLSGIEAILSLSAASPEEQEQIQAFMVDALATVASTLQTSDVAVQKFGAAVEALVGDGATMKKDMVDKVVDSLDTVMDSAQSQEGGMEAATGQSVLDVVDAIAKQQTTDSSDVDPETAQQLTNIASNAGGAVAKSLEPGQSVTISADQVELKVTVVAESDQDQMVGDVVVPGNMTWDGGRRLSATANSTKNKSLIAVVVTDWKDTNIFYDVSQDQTYDVQRDADLKNVIVLKVNATRNRAKLTNPVKFNIEVEKPPANKAPLCLRWDKEADEWSVNGVRADAFFVVGNEYTVVCASMHSSGTYAVIYTDANASNAIPLTNKTHVRTDTSLVQSQSNSSTTSTAPYDRIGGGGLGGPGAGVGVAIDQDGNGPSAGMIIAIIVLVLVFVACTVAGVGFAARMMRGSDEMSQPMVDNGHCGADAFVGDIDELIEESATHLPKGTVNVRMPASDANANFQVEFPEREFELDEPQVVIAVDRLGGVRMTEASHGAELHDESDMPGDAFEMAEHDWTPAGRGGSDFDSGVESPSARPLDFYGHDGDRDDIVAESDEDH